MSSTDQKTTDGKSESLFTRMLDTLSKLPWGTIVIVAVILYLLSQLLAFSCSTNGNKNSTLCKAMNNVLGPVMNALTWAINNFWYIVIAIACLYFIGPIVYKLSSAAISKIIERLKNDVVDKQDLVKDTPQDVLETALKQEKANVYKDVAKDVDAQSAEVLNKESVEAQNSFDSDMASYSPDKQDEVDDVVREFESV